MQQFDQLTRISPIRSLSFNLGLVLRLFDYRSFLPLPDLVRHTRQTHSSDCGCICLCVCVFLSLWSKDTGSHFAEIAFPLSSLTGCFGFQSRPSFLFYCLQCPFFPETVFHCGTSCGSPCLSPRSLTLSHTTKEREAWKGRAESGQHDLRPLSLGSVAPSDPACDHTGRGFLVQPKKDKKSRG